MMDFEDSAKRLARDQERNRSRAAVRGKPNLSEKAIREAEYRKKQQEQKKAERDRKQQLLTYQRHYMSSCDRSLSLKPLPSPSSSSSGSSSSTSSLQLTPTSIHGPGDKIALPPSVLQTLTSSEVIDNNSNSAGNPWMFRIGILNPNYEFPSSPTLQLLQPPVEDDAMDGDDDNDNDNDDDTDNKTAYLDELSHKYLAYTHCTVVEFTQEEGYVGIPQPIAKALLQSSSSSNRQIPTTRTVDPAGATEGPPLLTDMMDLDGEKPNGQDDDDDDDNDNDARPKTSPKKQQPLDKAANADMTPGHLAWGAFDIPDTLLEISMVQLPKGRGCTLIPTREAIQNNFYGLKDVKMVLEQSLIRTRATLAVGDTVSTWHRGIQFDLEVTKVIPSTFHAVTCINTDIEVDIGEATSSSGEPQSGQQQPPSQQPKPVDSSSSSRVGGTMLGTGYTLASSATPVEASTNKPSTGATTTTTSPTSEKSTLLAEPPLDQKEGICTVQIRSSVGTDKRRFHTSQAQVKDLFAFAAVVSNVEIAENAPTFRLVTNFPRRVIAMDTNNATSTLAEAGVQPGREVFMVELV